MSQVGKVAIKDPTSTRKTTVEKLTKRHHLWVWILQKCNWLMHHLFHLFLTKGFLWKLGSFLWKSNDHRSLSVMVDLFQPKETATYLRFSRWWLKQPIWTIWVKMGSSSQIFGVKIKNGSKYHLVVFEAGRPPECSFLLIYEIELSQVITCFHHHIKTWNLTIYFNALFPEVNLFHLNQLAFII